jgi:hypothetical protein
VLPLNPQGSTERHAPPGVSGREWVCFGRAVIRAAALLLVALQTLAACSHSACFSFEYGYTPASFVLDCVPTAAVKQVVASDGCSAYMARYDLLVVGRDAPGNCHVVVTFGPNTSYEANATFVENPATACSAAYLGNEQLSSHANYPQDVMCLDAAPPPYMGPTLFPDGGGLDASSDGH